MPRRSSFRLRLETLEDRLPPGDMLNSLSGAAPGLDAGSIALGDALDAGLAPIPRSGRPVGDLAAGNRSDSSAVSFLLLPQLEAPASRDLARAPESSDAQGTRATAESGAASGVVSPSFDLPAVFLTPQRGVRINSGPRPTSAALPPPGAGTSPAVFVGVGTDPYATYTSGDGYTGVGGLDRATVLALSNSTAASGYRKVQPPLGSKDGTDPGAPGPLDVTTQEYNFGYTAFTPTNFPGPVELIAEVKAPTDLSGGPYPLIVLLHGRHYTTYQGSAAFMEWPPSGSHQPIPSYQGYDYLGDVLASNGYIVVAISANGINARDNSVFDYGADARGQLVQRHLDIWRDLNATGTVTGVEGDPRPFGDRFVAKVDMQNIGTMGHSRGGEGVVQNYLYNQSLGSPYGIKAVFALAPTDFNRHLLNGVPFGVQLPYCDGDVWDLQGVHYFDDTRYNVPGDPAPRETVLVLGANHNFYNTVWTPGLFPAGTSDDGALSGCPPQDRLDPPSERATGVAYMSAFFRTYVGHEDFAAYLRGDAPPPPSAVVGSDTIFVSYHAPDDGYRRDLNRLTNPATLKADTLGGRVHPIGLVSYFVYGGDPPEPRYIFPGEGSSTARGARYPHTTPSIRAPQMTGLSQLVLSYDRAGAAWRNDIPAAAQDERTYYALQFRAGVNWNNTLNPAGQAPDFSVALADAEGDVARTDVSAWSNALFYPPGPNPPPGSSAVPKNVLNTVRIPLTAFTGVDLSRVTSVEFDFDIRPSGAFLFSDLAFEDRADLYP